MPTVLRVEDFRFFFYAADCPEPIHVHVTRGGGLAKVWVETLSISKSVGFGTHEEQRILRIVETNQAYIIARWNEFCGGHNV